MGDLVLKWVQGSVGRVWVDESVGVGVGGTNSLKVQTNSAGSGSETRPRFSPRPHIKAQTV